MPPTVWRAFLPVALALAIIGCRSVEPAAGGRPVELRRAQPLLGTYVVVTAFGPDRSRVQSAIEAAFAAVRDVDARMSLHRPDSELVRLNASATNGWTRVSPELFRVLVAAREIAVETDGAFDPTIRPVADLWGFIWKEHRLPTSAELAEVLPSVGYGWVELDPAERAVRFGRPGVSLDLGGIGKGYAVDAAVEALRSAGITSAMVRAGGDLRVLGAPPDRAAWEVQIEDPAKGGRRLTIALRDAAVSTSGHYENFFMVEGRRYSHLLDPRTGLPVQGVASCTVVAPTCLESDGLATGLFVLGAGRSLERAGAARAFRLVPDPAGPPVLSPRWLQEVQGRGAVGGR